MPRDSFYTPWKQAFMGCRKRPTTWNGSKRQKRCYHKTIWQSSLEKYNHINTYQDREKLWGEG